MRSEVYGVRECAVQITDGLCTKQQQQQQNAHTIQQQCAPA